MRPILFLLLANLSIPAHAQDYFYSDHRLKSNVENFDDDEEAEDMLRGFQVKTFNRQNYAGRQIGFIADQVDGLTDDEFETFVMGDYDGCFIYNGTECEEAIYQQIDAPQLMALNTKNIQILYDRLETLEGSPGSGFSGNYNDLTNKPVLFSGAYADLSGKPTLFSGAYADLTGKPALFDGTWGSLSGKPSTFAPSAHSHSIADVTGLQTSLDGKAGTAVATTSASGLMSAADKLKLNGVASGATVNDTDANLKNRANHTGTQSADTITDGTTNKAFTATEKTKLAAIPKIATYSLTTNASGDVSQSLTGFTSPRCFAQIVTSTTDVMYSPVVTTCSASSVVVRSFRNKSSAVVLLGNVDPDETVPSGVVVHVMVVE